MKREGKGSFKQTTLLLYHRVSSVVQIWVNKI